MSTRQYMINAAARHQAFIQRYGGSTYKQMMPFIRQALTDTIKRLEKATTDLSRKRYEILIRDLTAINQTIFSNMHQAVEKQALALAKYEAKFTSELVNKAANIPFNTVSPTIPQIEAAAFTSVLDKSLGNKAGTLQTAMAQFGAKKTGDIVQVVRQGFATGQTIKEMSTGIRDVMTTIVPRQANTLARTITNHIASQARQAFYEANSDLVTQYQVVATLDDGTCIECGSLDGQVFDADEFDPPPYHPNCKCTFIGVVDSKYSKPLDGGRPSVGADGAEEVSSRTTYNSWIKSQPASFQDEVLGVNRAELLRAGMPMQKFVDENYKPYTLDQLRTADNAHIFKKAGI